MPVITEAKRIKPLDIEKLVKKSLPTMTDIHVKSYFADLFWSDTIPKDLKEALREVARLCDAYTYVGETDIKVPDKAKVSQAVQMIANSKSKDRWDEGARKLLKFLPKVLKELDVAKKLIKDIDAMIVDVVQKGADAARTAGKNTGFEQINETEFSSLLGPYAELRKHDLYLSTTSRDIVLVLHYGSFEYQSGSTYFKYPNGKWGCYDRRGIDDSFYLFDKKPEEWGLIFAEQVQRVAQSIEHHKAATDKVDFGPVTRFFTPENKANLIKLLKSGKRYDVTPQGMGTGYSFSVSRHAGYKPAGGNISQLVGMPVFFTTFDHD